jgi:hypothetical protein
MHFCFINVYSVQVVTIFLLVMYYLHPKLLFIFSFSRYITFSMYLDIIYI